MSPTSPKAHCRQIITEASRRSHAWRSLQSQMKPIWIKGIHASPWQTEKGLGMIISGSPNQEEQDLLEKWFHYMFECTDLDTGELRWWVWRLSQKYDSCKKFRRFGKPRLV